MHESTECKRIICYSTAGFGQGEVVVVVVVVVWCVYVCGVWYV